MSNRDVTVEVDEIGPETDSALLVVFEGEKVWLPLSLVSRIDKGPNPAVTIPEWLAVKKGML